MTVKRMSGRTAAAAAAAPATIEQVTLQSFRIGPHFEITPNGLQVTGKPSFEACEGLWETLLTMSKTIEFAIGGAMRYFRERWGEKADQIISERTGWSLSTLRNFEWAEEKVPESVRRLDVLSFAHHQKIAKLPAAEQKKWLDRAAEGEEKDGVAVPWTVQRLAKAVRNGTDLPVTSWNFYATCSSEAQRTEAMKYLEGKGVKCKPSESRG